MKKLIVIMILISLALVAVACERAAEPDGAPIDFAPMQKSGAIDAFSLTSPQQDAVFTTVPTFRWENVPNADSYTLEICTSPEFAYMTQEGDQFIKQNYLKKYEEDQDVIDDASIENKQAAEMCSIYREIMNGTMEAYGTIISNNVNDIMKFLTALTLVISVPTLIASLFGMNLGGIPGLNSPWGFGVVCAISLFLAVVAGIFLAKKKMF